MHALRKESIIILLLKTRGAQGEENRQETDGSTQAIALQQGRCKVWVFSYPAYQHTPSWNPNTLFT